MRVDRVLVVLLLSSLLSQSAAAQWSRPGDITISAEPHGFGPTLQVTPFVPTDIFVVAFDPPEGVAQYRFAVDSLRQVGVMILEAELPEGAVNADSEPGRFDVTLSSCNREPTLVLARLSVIFLAPPPDDTAVFAVGLEGGESAPDWTDCLGTTTDFAPLPFCGGGGGRFPDGSLVLNATTWVCPVGDGTFGSLKAAYGND